MRKTRAEGGREVKLGDLEFLAIDFQGISGPMGIALGTDLTPLAAHVNKLLRERLGKAQMVTRISGCDMYWHWTEETWPQHKFTTARLVCIEKVEGK